MKIPCAFRNLKLFEDEREFYTCGCGNSQINENDELVFDGRHECGKTHENVTGVFFINCNMTKIPQNLTERFPNLRLLSVSDSNLRILNKGDLAEYKNLEYLNFDENRIEYLPGDLFDGFENIKMISFSKNNLKFIEPNILDGLDKLKFVDFSKNSNYDKMYFEDSDESNATLQEIKLDLQQKFHARFKSVQEIENLNASLTEEIQTLRVKLANEKILGLKISQQSKSHLLDDIKIFSKDKTFKDFKVIIDDREFPVHKFLLAARSPTLAEMLRNNPEAENLKLVDISVEIFELILKFLYTDELPNEDWKNFMHLFIAAGRLEIKELKNFAAVKLLDGINAENAQEVLRMSNKYEHDELRQKAFEEIKKNYPKIDFKDEWAENSEKIATIIQAYEDFKKFLV